MSAPATKAASAPAAPAAPALYYCRHVSTQARRFFTAASDADARREAVRRAEGVESHSGVVGRPPPELGLWRLDPVAGARGRYKQTAINATAKALGGDGETIDGPGVC